LPFVLSYIAAGLMITTMAIDVAAVSLRKLHSIGVKLKNAGKVKIWFGGRR
jgi:hypothetical protein